MIMKIVKLDSAASREELLDVIRNPELVNDRVKFDDNKGRPTLRVKDNGKILRMRCELIGGPSKDNGFPEGTYFIGTLKESDGVSRLRGLILTAPIYHTGLAMLLAFYVYYCISHGAFNPVPLILFIFSLVMFKGEFEKQGMIDRYLRRAFKRAENPMRNT